MGNAQDRLAHARDDRHPAVPAAGDIVRGASLVVWAIRDGRDAAESTLGLVECDAEVPAEEEKP